MSTVETISKSTWNTHGNSIKKTEIKQLYDMLHKTKSSDEREEIMRRTIYFSPEYETVFKNLIHAVNDAFITDDNCYKQFKDILQSFQEAMSDGRDESGDVVQDVEK